jgi:hypothetical protein
LTELTEWTEFPKRQGGLDRINKIKKILKQEGIRAFDNPLNHINPIQIPLPFSVSHFVDSVNSVQNSAESFPQSPLA